MVHFRQRTVKKKYTLITQGPWPGKVRAVRDRLLRYETDWGERRVRVDAGAGRAYGLSDLGTR